MKTAKALLALLVSMSLALPASAGLVHEAMSIEGSGEHALAMPLSPETPNTLETLLQPDSSASPAQIVFPPAATAAAQPSEISQQKPAGDEVESNAAATAPNETAAAAPQTGAPAPTQSLAALQAAPVGPVRSLWNRFWTNSTSRIVTPQIVFAAASGAAGVAGPLALLPAAKTAATTAAKAVDAVKAGVPSPEAAPDLHSVFFAHAAPHAHTLASMLAGMAPYAEAGGILLLTYAASSALTRFLNYTAEKNNLPHRSLAPLRNIAKTFLWTVGGMVALTFLGASATVLTTGWGLIIFTGSLLVKDAIDNRAHGVMSMIIRPFKIGMRVSIDGKNATVQDITLDDVTLLRDDGEIVVYAHKDLADKTVIIYGHYAPASSEKKLSISKSLKFRDAWESIWASIDHESKLAFAVLLVTLTAAWLAPVAALASLAPYACALATVWMAWRAKAVIQAATTLYAQKTGLPKELKVLAQFLASMAFWAFGSSALMYLFGTPWAWLVAHFGTLIGLTTVAGLSAILLGPMAYTTFVTLIANGLEIDNKKALNTFRSLKNGTGYETMRADTWAEAAPLEGEILDVTARDTVIKLPEDPANPGPRYARIPHTHPPLVVLRPPIAAAQSPVANPQPAPQQGNTTP